MRRFKSTLERLESLSRNGHQIPRLVDVNSIPEIESLKKIVRPTDLDAQSNVLSVERELSLLQEDLRLLGSQIKVQPFSFGDEVFNGAVDEPMDLGLS